MAQEKIILCDDDQQLRESLTAYLEMENMIVTCCATGADLLPILARESFDLLLLDVMLPDADGIDLLKIISPLYPGLPIIMMTARDESHYVVMGLRLGADDYVTKPFIEVELLERIRSHIRRARQSGSRKCPRFIRYKNLTLDTAGLKLIKNENEEIQLSGKLFKLLKLFMENPGQVFTKQQLYEQGWEDSYYDEQTIMVYVGKLRKLIEKEPNHPELLKTIRGVGYKLG